MRSSGGLKFLRLVIRPHSLFSLLPGCAAANCWLPAYPALSLFLTSFVGHPQATPARQGLATAGVQQRDGAPWTKCGPEADRMWTARTGSDSPTPSIRRDFSTG